MTDKVKQELEELKDKCIDHRSGKPKKSAETADLQRLQALLKMQPDVEAELESKPEPEKLLPLTADEREELENLEARAKNGRHLTMPSAVEMWRLGKLRARAKIEPGKNNS